MEQYVLGLEFQMDIYFVSEQWEIEQKCSKRKLNAFKAI